MVATRDFIAESIPSAFRCTIFDERTEEGQFPGFTLSFESKPLEVHVDDPSMILNPKKEQTTTVYFDGTATKMHNTSDIEMSHDEITIRDKTGSKFVFGYTPESHWSRTDSGWKRYYQSRHADAWAERGLYA